MREVAMKKIILLLAVIALLSACICKPILGGLPQGRKVKVDIEVATKEKTYKGELLSVNQELIIIRFYDDKLKKDVLLAMPLLDTEVCKVKKGCGPIGGLFAKNRKFTFKGNTPAKINENISDLSHDALYSSKIPVWVKEQMTPVDQYK
jgi:hypothetical protein